MIYMFAQRARLRRPSSFTFSPTSCLAAREVYHACRPLPVIAQRALKWLATSKVLDPRSSMYYLLILLISCRQKKRACNSENPCHTCRNNGVECKYSRQIRVLSPNEESAKSARRIKRLETALSERDTAFNAIAARMTQLETTLSERDTAFNAIAARMTQLELLLSEYYVASRAMGAKMNMQGTKIIELMKSYNPAIDARDEHGNSFKD